jgi:hypothetical protein
MPYRIILGRKIKIIGKRVKIESIVRDKRPDDVSTTYNRNGILYYKAHPEAKPKVLAVDGYAIWYYHEFFADIEVEGKQYRLFYNPIVKKFFANERVNVEGKKYLKNPSCDDDMVKELLEFIKNFPAPENKKLNSLNKAVKQYRKEKSKGRIKQKRRGRKEDDYLKRATLWSIENQQSGESRTETARRAYQEFKDEAQSEPALIQSVRNKWTNLSTIYKDKYPMKKGENGKYKRRVTFKAFVKAHFKLPQIQVEKH